MPCSICDLQINMRRNGNGFVGVHDHEPRIGTRSREPCDSVADRPAGHPCANLIDDAGALEPRDEWELHRVEPAAVVDVDEVDPCCSEPDAHLTLAGYRIGHLHPLKDIGTTS
jgi:hypothetical protein